MTWGEFKRVVESLGVSDYTEIREIRWEDKGGRLTEPPEVKVVAVRIG